MAEGADRVPPAEPPRPHSRWGQPAAAWAATLVTRLDPPGDFNFEHFRMRHLIAELMRTLRPQGLLPGATAPDLELISTEGGRLRIRDLLGMPVLLHLVSYT